MAGVQSDRGTTRAGTVGRQLVRQSEVHANHRGGVTVTLNGAVPPGDNDIEVQTNAPSAGAVTLTLSGGEPVELPVESGRSTVFSRAYGAGQMSDSPPTRRVCACAGGSRPPVAAG